MTEKGCRIYLCKNPNRKTLEMPRIFIYNACSKKEMRS